MTRHVECTAPDAPLDEVAQRMKELDVGSMPVCKDDRLAGIVTDRDIVLRSVAAGHDPHADHATDVMTPHIVYVFEDQDVAEAAELMRDKQIRRLPVLSREKRLIGIVSLGDLAVEMGDDRMAGHALEGISEPAVMT
jgi:CBS domain-containing protein